MKVVAGLWQGDCQSAFGRNKDRTGEKFIGWQRGASGEAEANERNAS
jgi:hypothetical protein